MFHPHQNIWAHTCVPSPYLVLAAGKRPRGSAAAAAAAAAGGKAKVEKPRARKKEKEEIHLVEDSEEEIGKSNNNRYNVVLASLACPCALVSCSRA